MPLLARCVRLSRAPLLPLLPASSSLLHTKSCLMSQATNDAAAIQHICRDTKQENPGPGRGEEAELQAAVLRIVRAHEDACMVSLTALLCSCLLCDSSVHY